MKRWQEGQLAGVGQTYFEPTMLLVNGRESYSDHDLSVSQTLRQSLSCVFVRRNTCCVDPSLVNLVNGTILFTVSSSCSTLERLWYKQRILVKVGTLVQSVCFLSVYTRRTVLQETFFLPARMLFISCGVENLLTNIFWYKNVHF